MRQPRALLGAAAFLLAGDLLLAGAAAAQQPQEAPQQGSPARRHGGAAHDAVELQEAEADRTRARLYRSSRIVGSPVRDLQGRRIGDIHDLVLGSRRGDIAYAIVAFGGVMGVGKTFHPVPWVSLQPRDGGRYYALNADRATVRAAPGFDLARWPDLGDQRWRDEVDRYWARQVGHAVDADNDPLSAPSAAGASGRPGSSGSSDAAPERQTEGR